MTIKFKMSTDKFQSKQNNRNCWLPFSDSTAVWNLLTDLEIVNKQYENFPIAVEVHGHRAWGNLQIHCTLTWLINQLYSVTFHAKNCTQVRLQFNVSPYSSIF